MQAYLGRQNCFKRYSSSEGSKCLPQSVLKTSWETNLAGMRCEMPQGCLKDLLRKSIRQSTSAGADMTSNNDDNDEVNIFGNDYIFTMKSYVGRVDNI